MALDCYLSGKTILIDAYGWGDLLLGVVVCAIKPPNPMVMERRIPTTSFQPPNFKEKKYLVDATKIADEIIAVMQPNSETCFNVCSEYILSSVITHLQSKGFKVQRVESTGELRQQVENAYFRWCVEKGVPKRIFAGQSAFLSFYRLGSRISSCKGELGENWLGQLGEQVEKRNFQNK